MSEYTVKELKDMAREIPIKGYSTMRKAELIKALKDEGYIKSSPKKVSPKKQSPKKPSPQAIQKDFQKMTKPDITKLIKQLAPDYKVKAAFKKAELIEILESLIVKTVNTTTAVAVAPPPQQEIEVQPAVVPVAPAVNLDKMTVVQLKEYAMENRGIKIGAMKKADIIDLLKGEVCDPSVGSYCTSQNESCDIRYKSCVKSVDEKLEKLVINGHNVVGTKKSIEELKKKLEVSKPAEKVPSPVIVPPIPVAQDVPSKPFSGSIESVLGEITRPPVTTAEFRQNLERLKICLGLMSR